MIEFRAGARHFLAGFSRNYPAVASASFALICVSHFRICIFHSNREEIMPGQFPSTQAFMLTFFHKVPLELVVLLRRGCGEGIIKTADTSTPKMNLLQNFLCTVSP
jgi:hypothetical protein